MTTTLPSDDRDPRLRALLANASLDAPRVDLWERLETPVLALERRRRAPFRALRALAAALALLLAGGAMLAIFSLADDEPERASEGVRVPDLLLLETWGADTQSSELRAYLPHSNDLLTVLQGVNFSGPPVVSQDGRQLVYAGWEQEEAGYRLSVWAFDSASLTSQWRADIGLEDFTPGESWPHTTIDVAIAGDAVYAASHRWDTASPVTISAFDRVTGALRDRTGVEFDGAISNAPTLFAAPNGAALYLTSSLSDRPQASWDQQQLTLVTFALPDLREVSRATPGASGEAANWFSGWDVGMSADGRSLWELGFVPGGSEIGVTFLDLASGTFGERVAIPTTSRDLWFYQHGVSADGTRLTVFYPGTGELHVVDLASRTLVSSVTIDMSRVQFPGESGSILDRAWGALRALVVEDAAAKVYIAGELQFSPDGARMYAVGVKGDSINGEPRGVLVVNTRTWQVEQVWLADENPLQVVLAADGRTLYLQTADWGSAGGSQLVALDTATGGEVFRSESDGGTIWTLAQLYRESWGTTPRIDGVDPDALRASALDPVAPFAKLVVSASAMSLVAGDSVTIEARFVDPASGETVREDDDDVRYDPPDHVRALLAKGGGDPQTVVLTRAEEGVYRGAARLSEAGEWSVKVVAERGNEPQRRVTLAGGIVVQHALIATDGRRYRLAVETNPAEPAAGADTTVTIRIVDSETGAPLPADTSLPDGLPAEIDVSFYEPTLGVSSRTFANDGHGSWRGTYQFFGAGTWSVRADFPGDGERAGGVRAGTVVVR